MRSTLLAIWLLVTDPFSKPAYSSHLFFRQKTIDMAPCAIELFQLKNSLGSDLRGSGMFHACRIQVPCQTIPGIN